MKRYCQTLKLYDDKKLIDTYCEAHQHIWPEIEEGIRSVGILDMQIYLYDNTLFMIVDTIDDFDWEIDMTRLSMLPRQAEWETYMSRFQRADPSASSKDKWKLMKGIFELKK